MYKNYIAEQNTSRQKIANLYFEDSVVTYRILDLVEDVGEDVDALDPEILNLSNKNYKGQIFKVEDQYYRCIYNKLCVMDTNIWKPYKEIYIVITDEVNRRDSICILDRYAETYLSKMNHNTFNKRNKIHGGYTVAKFLVLPGTTFLTAPAFFTIDFKLYTNIKFEHKITMEELEHDSGFGKQWRNYYFPSLKVDGPTEIQSNGSATFTIEAFHHEGQKCLDDHTYYLECIQGYAPNKEINVIGGNGEFKVMALGLEPGETMRFKVNDRLWTDKAEVILNVI